MKKNLSLAGAITDGGKSVDAPLAVRAGCFHHSFGARGNDFSKLTFWDRFTHQMVSVRIAREYDASVIVDGKRSIAR